MPANLIPAQLKELDNPDALVKAGPFKTLMFFTVFTFLNMSSRYSILGVMRPTVLMTIVFMAMIFSNLDALKDRLKTPGTQWMGALMIYIFVTLPFVTYPGSVVHKNLEDFAKWAIFFLLIMAFVDSEKRLRLFIGAFVSSTVFRCLEPVVLHLTTGYWGSKANFGDTGESMARLSGAPADSVNPNGLAFMCVTAFIFVHNWAWARGGDWKRKVIYAIVVPGLIYGLVLTGSRSGVLAFGVAAIGIIWTSKNKIFGIAVLVLGVIGIAAHLSGDMADRYTSIYSQNTRNASTANGRVEGWKKNLELVERRPIFGYGLGTSLEASFNLQGGTHYAHNLYLEVLIELGIGGFIIFAGYIVSVCQITLGMTKQIKNSGELLPDGHVLLWLPKSLMLWTGMCLFFDIFSYGLSNYEWYVVGGLAMVCGRMLQARNAAAEQIPGEGPKQIMAAGPPPLIVQPYRSRMRRISASNRIVQ